MIAFLVEDMRCGHCAGTITRAVNDLDAEAFVTIDLARHRVDIDSKVPDAAAFAAALTEAGYTPVLWDEG